MFAELRRRNVFRVGFAYVIMAWLLLQIVDIVASIINPPDWVAQSILLLLGVGFPIAVFFAWAFELTPEGIKLERNVNRSQSITNKTGRRLDLVIFGILVIAVGWLGYDKLTPDMPDVAEEIVADDIDESPSIAVLPFVNMSADESSAYFSDGLADTLLHMLAQIRELRVAARTSSFQFRDQSMHVADIGQQLNVSTVLEGSVQRSGDKIRVTAQLIDVSNGYHLWSGNFDRELNDIFVIQDEIAAEVVAALKLSLLGEEVEKLQTYATDNIEAYTQYLLALPEIETYTFNSLTSAINHLQSSIALDPAYAPAYVSLAMAYHGLQDTGAINKAEGLSDARNAAAKALELSPDSSEALTILGITELDDGNSALAERLLLKAIENGPNNTLAMQGYAYFLTSEARSRESIEILRKVLRRDPLSQNAHFDLAENLRFLRLFEEAEVIVNRLQEIDPQSPYGVILQGRINMNQGKWAEAIQQFKQAAAIDPNDPEIASSIGGVYLLLDLPAEAANWVDRAAEIDPEHPVSRSRPLFLRWAVRGNDADNVRQARHLLEESIENRRNSRTISAYMLLFEAERTGDYGSLLELLDGLHPGLFEDPTVGATDDLDMTFLLGRVFYESGETERGLELLDAWSADVEKSERAYGVSLNSIMIDLLKGDEAAALEKIRSRELRKYANGFDRFFFQRDPLFLTIADEPQVIELIEDLTQHGAEQQAVLRTLENQSSL